MVYFTVMRSVEYLNNRAALLQDAKDYFDFFTKNISVKITLDK